MHAAFYDDQISSALWVLESSGQLNGAPCKPMVVSSKFERNFYYACFILLLALSVVTLHGVGLCLIFRVGWVGSSGLAKKGFDGILVKAFLRCKTRMLQI